MDYIGGMIALAIGIGLVIWFLGQKVAGSPDIRTARSPEVEDDGPPLSIVALMSELPFVDLNVLQRCLEESFDVDFDSADPPDDGEEVAELRFADPDNFAMETPMGTYMVRLQGHMHGVIAHGDPYFEDIDAAIESVNDLRSKEALLAHRCWIAVDHVGDLPASDELRETYARLASLLLALIDPTLCTAILVPRAQKFYPWREELAEALTGGDVLEELSDKAHVPVTGIDGNDPELQAAVATARERWPEFVDAFQSGQGEAFGMKFRLPTDDEDDYEFPWLEVTAIHGDIIQGKLANEPLGRRDLHEGSKVTTRLADLNDWLYVDENGEQQGGFTIPVLMRGMQDGGQHG